jgi:purine nucleoside phosphorylase
MIGYVPGTGWPKIKGLKLAHRKHVYQGFTGYEHIDELYAQGVRKVILGASVGGLTVPVGTVDWIGGLVTLFYSHPGISFLNMSEPFEKMGKLVHAFVPGPRFETQADATALRSLGADVVGMSITPEVIRANELKMKVVALVCVTNMSGAAHEHKDTIANAKRYNKQICEAIQDAI